MISSQSLNPFKSLALLSPMARMISEFDWALTELGAIESWDPALIVNLRTVLACPISMCLAWGPQRRYFYNDAYVPILRERHPRALGAEMEDVWPEIWDQVLALAKKVDAGGYVHEADLLFNIEIDGKIRENYFTFAYSPVFSSEGGVAGMLCTILDTTSAVISARRTEKTELDLARSVLAIEAERIKLRTVLEQSPMAIAVFDGPTHAFAFANQLYRSVFLGGREVKGQDIEKVLPEAAAQGFIELLDRVYRTGERLVGKEAVFTYQTPDGREQTRSLDFVYEPIRDVDGKIEGILAAINDVTERVLATRDIDQARREAEVANAAKSSFLANMSHEIRTPLGAILGFTELLKAGDLAKPDSDKYLEIIGRNGHALIRIIDDILDLSKIEAGKLEIAQERVDLKEMLRDIEQMFEDRARSKGITLTVDVSRIPAMKLLSDAARIRQVLVNLIGNAVKFTSTGGVKVSTEFTSAPQGFQRVAVSVKDSGIGMTSEDAAKLFRPFTQADNANTRKFGGTGLGLALSKNLAQALGGTVEIKECFPGKGCTFEFSFSAEGVVSELNQKISAPVSPDANSLDGARILVVDDSPDNRHLVQLYLRKRGAEVVQADDGQRAIEILRGQVFDLVLMDIQMPGLDGYGTLAELKRIGLKTPVIALTAHAMKEEKARAMAAGFVDYVTKPIEAALLVDAIAKALPIR